MRAFAHAFVPGEEQEPPAGQPVDTVPPIVIDHERDGSTPRWPVQLRRWRMLGLLVILPTLLVAAFEYLVVANQYESEAHFMVRTPQPTAGNLNGIGQALGLGASLPPSDAHSIGDYLLSHDAVSALGRNVDLTAIFRRPEADPFTRLWTSTPTPETLLKYYREQIKVDFSSDTGITTLTVHAFRPVDSKQLAELLLRLGEDRANTFNVRAMDDGLVVARKQLADAEAAVAGSQSTMTGFRQGGRDIDPERSSSAQIELAAGLEGQLARARAKLASMAGAVSPTSPQYIAVAAQVRAIAAQVGAAKGRLAGPSHAMAAGLGAYEGLKLRQEFAAKRYEAAASALETAREQMLRQQLFVVRVVEPNMPVKALYPKRLKLIMTVFFGLLLGYGIGWLILAGVREHAG